MKKSLKHLFALSALGLSLGLSAQAQPFEGPGQGLQFEQHRHMMEKFQEKRLATLKSKLKVTASQEAAWQQFVLSHQPPIKPLISPADREALAKMSTPERLEKMQAQFDAHYAAVQDHMKQRNKATLDFYNQLSDEQKKEFDAQTLPPVRREHPNH
jgi:protein CpxP